MASSSLLTRAVAGLRLIRSQSSRLAAYSTCGALFKRPCNRAPALSPLVRSRFRFVRNAVTASSSGTMESSVAQQATSGEPVVSADWLQANLREPDLKMLDEFQTLLPQSELQKKFEDEGYIIQQWKRILGPQFQKMDQHKII